MTINLYQNEGDLTDVTVINLPDEVKLYRISTDKTEYTSCNSFIGYYSNFVGYCSNLVKLPEEINCFCIYFGQYVIFSFEGYEKEPVEAENCEIIFPEPIYVNEFVKDNNTEDNYYKITGINNRVEFVTTKLQARIEKLPNCTLYCTSNILQEFCDLDYFHHTSCHYISSEEWQKKLEMFKIALDI